MTWKPGAAAIVGLGNTPVGRIPDRTGLQLHAEVALKAVEDAGLKLADIDGVLTAGPMLADHLMHANFFAQYLGLTPRYCAKMQIGGASFCAMVKHAALVVDAGLANYVLIACADVPLTGAGRSGSIQGMVNALMSEFDEPYGCFVPATWALMAARHMYEYGTTRDQLSAVAVAQRAFAALNPEAFQRDRISLEDVANSRPISSPLRLLDCSPICDGGGALIVTTAERARDLRRPPVRVLGAGEGHQHMDIDQSASTVSFWGVRESGRLAYQTAGVTPADIDAVEVYDGYTIAVIIQLEELGFCPKGEGGRFVEHGARTGPDGELPVNTHGGLLAMGNPLWPGGLFHVIEGARQIRGEAGPRQVRGAELVLVHNNGGSLSSNSTLILGR